MGCPWERNIEKDHKYKERKYARLVADLERDYRVYHFSIEISARGFVSKENKSLIKAFLLKVCDVRNGEMQKLITVATENLIQNFLTIFIDLLTTLVIIQYQ